MSSLYHDSRLYYILGANSLSAIGSELYGSNKPSFSLLITFHFISSR